MRFKHLRFRVLKWNEMKTIEMKFIKARVQQYTPIWEVLWNKTLNIMEICTPKGVHIH